MKEKDRILVYVETLYLLECRKKTWTPNSYPGIAQYYLVELEWRLGGFNQKDCKGIQSAALECTADEGS